MAAHRLVVPALLFALAAGCDDGSGGPGPEENAGGKADQVDGGDEARETGELSCVVVEVLDSNVLEEGLGSIYDFDEEGFSNVDGDSLEAGVARSQFSELDSGLMLDVGQLTLGFDAGDRIERVETDDDRIEWVGTEAEFGTQFTLRVFTESMLGYVLVQEDGEDKPHDLAKIDCRAGVSVPVGFE